MTQVTSYQKLRSGPTSQDRMSRCHDDKDGRSPQAPAVPRVDQTVKNVRLTSATSATVPFVVSVRTMLVYETDASTRR